MKESEELFIDRINQKQKSAYHELFRRYYRALVMFAMKYVGSQGEAEDMVQDLFVAVWERQEKFLSYHSFRVFLYTSIRNTCLNRIKHQRVEEKYIGYSLLYSDHSEEYDYEMLEEEIYRRLFEGIDELPPRCREIFLMYLDGKRNEEIADTLQLSIMTVKTQKKRAVRYLRERLGELYIFISFIFSF